MVRYSGGDLEKGNDYPLSKLHVKFSDDNTISLENIFLLFDFFYIYIIDIYLRPQYQYFFYDLFMPIRVRMSTGPVDIFFLST